MKKSRPFQLLIVVLALFCAGQLYSQTMGVPVTMHPGELQVNYIDGTIGVNTNTYTAAGTFENYVYLENPIVSAGGKDILLTYQGTAAPNGYSLSDGGKYDDECFGMRQFGSNFILVGYFSDTAKFGSATVVSKGGKDIFIVSYSTAGIFSWVRTYGSPGDDWASFLTNGSSASEILVAINYSDTLVAGTDTLFSSGGSDAGMLQISTSGTILNASKFYGGSGNDRVNYCQWSGAGFYCSGSFSDSVLIGNTMKYSNGGTDFIVMRVDAANSPLWCYTNGGAGNDEASDFILQAGNLWAVGNFEQTWTEGSSTFTSSGMQDCFFYQINFTTGVPVSGFAYGGAGQDTVTSLSWDGIMSLLTLAGSFEQTMVLDMITLVAVGMTDAYVVRTDVYGLFNSGQRFGGLGDDIFNGATFSNANLEYMVWGAYSYIGATNTPGSPYPIEHYGFINKYSNNFIIVTGASSTWGSTAEFDVDQDAYGNHYVTVNYTGCLTIDTMKFSGIGGHTIVAKYDPTGNLIWLRSSTDVADNGQTSTVHSGGHFISVSSTGYCYVMGHFRSKCTFGSTQLTPLYENSTGRCDWFLMCYDPAGAVVFAKRIASNTNSLEMKSLAINNNMQLVASGYWSTGTLQLEGAQTLAAVGQKHGFLLRYTSIGTLGTSLRTGGTGCSAWMDEATIDNSNNMYAIGYFKNGPLADLGLTTNDPTKYNTFIVKYNSAGTPIWTQNIQATTSVYNDHGSIVVDSVAGLYINGPFSMPINLPNGDQYNHGLSNGFDYWVARADVNGNFLWSNNFQNNSTSYGFNIYSLTSDNHGKGCITFNHKDSLLIDQYPVPDNSNSRHSVYFFDMQSNLLNILTEPEQGIEELIATRNLEGKITFYGYGENPYSTFGADTFFSNETSGECFFITYLDTCNLAQFSYSESGGIYQFTDNTIGEDSLIWDFGDGNFATASNPTHMYSSTGTFTVTLVSWTNCGPDTCTALVTWNPLTITNPLSTPQATLFPNPTHMQVTVTADAPIAGIRIFSTQGQMVGAVDGKQQQWLIVPLEEYSNGILLFCIEFTDGRTAVSKVYKTE